MAKGKGPAMRKLAVLLAERAKVPVQADYTTVGRATTWFVQWSNGPTADTMRRHVTALAKSVPGVDIAELGYRRDYDERHLLAAWLRRAQHDQRAGGRWSAESYVQETGFPDDIPEQDRLWELADYALAAYGEPRASVGQVIEQIAKIGVGGLCVEHWLDQPDHLDPASARRLAAPLLDTSGLSEATRRQLRTVAAAVVRELAGDSPRGRDPRVRVLVAEAARAVLTQPVDEEQRRRALECVTDGTPLSTLSVRIGKSESTLAKRWGSAEFNRDLAPLAWLREHEKQWAQACLDAVAEVRTSSQIAADRDVWPLLSALEQATENSDAGWRRLLDTPETIRKLLAAVPQARRRARTLHPRGGDERDNEPAAGPALHRLAALLAHYETAPIPQRRGGPRRTRSHAAEVTPSRQDTDGPPSAAPPRIEPP